MTISANLTIEDISEGPAPINVLASAKVEDGSLSSDPGSGLTYVEVKFLFDLDEVPFKVGDIIAIMGHSSVALSTQPNLPLPEPPDPEIMPPVLPPVG